MSYALIELNPSKWSYRIKTYNEVGSLDILLPCSHKRFSNSFGKKVLKILNKANINDVVISDDVLKNDTFCRAIYNSKKRIITGRNMYKSIILRILKDISQQMLIDIKKLKLVMLIEDYTMENINLIKDVAKAVKNMTIITTDKDKFDMIKKELFDDYGIVIKVYEKNFKDYRNANIIVNVDFFDYDMNKIEVSPESIIICGFATNYQIPVNFNGIVIKRIDIIDTQNNNDRINDLALCEAKIYKYLRKLKENDRAFERNGFKINGYFGENGKIMTDDFKKLGKNILDK